MLVRAFQPNISTAPWSSPRWDTTAWSSSLSDGQERNVEVGVLVEGKKFARELVHQWRNAAEAGVFRQ